MERGPNKEDEDIMNKEFLKGKDLSNQTNYGRPPVPSGLNDRTDDMIFMQIDCDNSQQIDCKYIKESDFTDILCRGW